MSKVDVYVPLEQIPPEHRLRFPIVQNRYLLNGKMEEWTGKMEEIYSPICVEQKEGKWVRTLIGMVPSFSEREALAALDNCVKAYDNGKGVWPTLTVQQRIDAVQRFTQLMIARRTEVVNLLMWEICKTKGDAEKEFDRTVAYIRATIESLKDLDRNNSRFTIEEGIIAQIRRAPLGVVLCMGPFNYPLNETFTTLIPALIMGNVALFKPARFGVLLLGPILECFQQSFPAGVVNSIHGEGRVIVGPVIQSGKVDVLAFIGGSRTADAIKKQHPMPHRLRSILGLDAKNPGVILPCADIELAVRECVLGSLSFNGQRCTALKLLFVHRTLADRFLGRFVEEVNRLSVGLPWTGGAKITPLPEPDKCARMRALIEDAVGKGARVVNEEGGGGSASTSVFFPAVVYPVTPSMRLFHEEQFGPVVPIAVYDDLETPIGFIRESPFGQQVSIFGTNSRDIAKLVDPLVNQVCRVNINSQCQRGPDTFPFTGRKDSAEFTLSVSDALRAFSIRTLVATKQNPINQGILETILHERQSSFLSTDYIF